MKLEIRKFPQNDQPLPLYGVAVVGGDFLPGQAETSLEYRSSAHDPSLGRFTVAFEFGHTMQLNETSPPTGLAELSRLWSTLSDDNKRRFLTMYAEQIIPLCQRAI